MSQGRQGTQRGAIEESESFELRLEVGAGGSEGRGVPIPWAPGTQPQHSTDEVWGVMLQSSMHARVVTCQRAATDFSPLRGCSVSRLVSCWWQCTGFDGA